MKRTRVRVAIIDSGIDITHPCCKGYRIHSFSVIGTDPTDYLGHGTSVFGVISRSLYGKEVEFFCIKALESYNSGDPASLVKALELVERIGQINIVNMSLGVNSVASGRELFEVTERLARNGTLLITAFDNNGSYSFPASFDHCVGVVGSNRYPLFFLILSSELS